METRHIFGNIFYSHGSHFFYGQDVDYFCSRIQDGVIDVEEPTQHSILSSCSTCIWGLTPAQLEVSNRIKDIITQVQEKRCEQLVKEIRDQKGRGFDAFQKNLSTLMERYEKTQRSALSTTIANVWGKLRSMLRLSASYNSEPLAFFNSTEDQFNFFKDLKKTALQLTQADESACKHSVQITQGNCSKLNNASLHKLECGLKNAIHIQLDEHQKLLVEYDRYRNQFDLGVRALNFCEALKLRPNGTLAQASIQEDGKSFDLDDGYESSAGKKGPVFNIHQIHSVKPGATYSINTANGPVQFTITKRPL